MIQNLIPFFRKRILFLLPIICFIVVTIFSVQYSEAEKQQKKRIKDNRSAEIKKILDKGIIMWDSEKNDSAYFYFNKAQSLCEPKEDYADYYVESLNYITEILQRHGDYYEVETTLVKALPYLDKTTSAKYAINTYTFMAYNYHYIYDNEKALFYHKKALKKAVSTFRKSRIISEIAFVYTEQGKYQEAIDLLGPIAWLNIEDKITPSNTAYQRTAKLYNLGLSYLYLGNHKQETFDCFNESLKVALTLNDDYELITNYYAFYKYYQKYNNPELKKLNIEKAYYYAKKTKSKPNEITMLGHLIEADNAANSKKHFKVYSRMLDSLIVSRKKSKNQFANLIYDSKKDKAENLELKNQKAQKELQLQRQKNRSYISYVIISISILSLVFIFFYVTTKGKKESNNEVFKNEMRISEKLHFELEKDIDKILQFTENFELEKENNKEEFLSHLNNIYLKTRNISRANSEIVTDENFEKALKEMISGYSNQKLNIIINGLNTYSWCKIDRVKKITVFRVLQEIFENMKTSNNSSLASITFKRDDKNILITYADNSNTETEVDDSFIKRFANIDNRLKSVKGSYDVSLNPNQGFKFFIKLPL
ncbi:hypothetical protein [Flavobacterium anhuiense]|uniref:hypothetical protein n=1 Tax=Flavobacterium anhuiense TaxID=459526 RepID=UPI003D9561E8